jgi:hypothetical protein
MPVISAAEVEEHFQQVEGGNGHLYMLSAPSPPPCSVDTVKLTVDLWGDGDETELTLLEVEAITDSGRGKANGRTAVLKEVAATLGNPSYSGPKKSAPRLFFNVKMGTITVAKCLVDSGANVSLCSLSTYRALENAGVAHNISTDTSQVTTLSGAGVNILFNMKTDVNIGEQYTYRSIFGVVSDETMRHPVLMGMNFLSSVGRVLVDFQLGRSCPCPSAQNVLSLTN